MEKGSSLTSPSTPSADEPVAPGSSSPQTLNPYGDHVFKEGGTKAWLTVVGSWLIYFATFGMLTAFGVFQSYYVQVTMKGRSPADVAWIGSLQLCLLFFTGLFVGKLFDEGYFHHIMIIGSILEVLGLFMLSISKTYTQIFLSQGVCVGLGMGFLFLPGVSVVQHHFYKKRAFANGIGATGSAIGGILFSIMLNNMFKPTSTIGFKNGVRIAAGIVAVALIIANLLMRTDIPPRKKRKVQVPIPNPAKFFTEPVFLFVLLGVSMSFLALYFPVFYIQLDAELHGIDEDLAFYLLTVYNAVSIPGRLLPNLFADKIGIYNVLITCMIACAGIIVGMLGIKQDSVAAAVTVAALYGFFSGAVISLLTPLAPSFSKGPHEIGIRLGVIFLFIGPCGLMSGPIAGWLLGDASKPHSWHWERPIWFAFGLTLVSAALLTVARHFLSRQLRTWRI
ncbi:MFS general substrate transporter [Auriculariales sp. MPI-PUGE-AT-0066]|nr:MFS general substrate transporter [Auriculariales sp. MPI-PUGE-AT-0066]